MKVTHNWRERKKAGTALNANTVTPSDNTNQSKCANYDLDSPIFPLPINPHAFLHCYIPKPKIKPQLVFLFSFQLSPPLIMAEEFQESEIVFSDSDEARNSISTDDEASFPCRNIIVPPLEFNSRAIHDRK